MTSLVRTYAKIRSVVRRAEPWRWTRGRQTIGASVSALGLALAASLAPQPAQAAAEQLTSYVDAHAQTFEVAALVKSTIVARDTYSATPGIATLAAGGTNHDWAKLVLLFAKLPMTESNVTYLPAGCARRTARTTGGTATTHSTTVGDREAAADLVVTTRS